MVPTKARTWPYACLAFARRSAFIGLALLPPAAAETAVAQTASSDCRTNTAAAPVTVSGTVTDTSGAVISGALITLECGTTRVRTESGPDGRFTVSARPGSYSALIEKPGFEAAATVLDASQAGSARLDVSLAVAAISETTVVSARGFEQVVRQAPASVTVLSSEELDMERHNNLAEVLVDVEGVDVGNTVGKTGGLTVSMRGMPSDYTLVLIDGRRQNAAGSVTPNGFGETSTGFLPPMAAIERIEVVRGPMSTLYGSDAMGGVINIITRKVSERWSGSMDVDFTLQSNRDFGDTGSGNVYLNGPLVKDKLGLAFRSSGIRRQAATLVYDDVEGNPIEIDQRGPSPVEATTRNVGGRLTFTPTQHHDVWFDAEGYWQDYDNSQGQLGTLSVQGGYGPEQRFNRQQFTLAHTGRFGGFGILDSSLMRNSTATVGRTIPPGTPGRLAGDPRTLEATNTVLDSRLLSTRGRHTFTVGGQWWDAHMVDAVAPAPYQFTQLAVFAEDEWRFMPQVALTVGIRYDHHDTFGGNTSPRGYLVYNATPRLTVKGGVSRGFKTPRLDQLADGITGFTGQGTRPTIGTPTLTPETSTTTEAGVHYASPLLTAGFTFFNNEFDDKIASGPGLSNCSFALAPNRPGCADYGYWPAVDLFGQSVNIDEAYTRGFETSASVRLPAGVMATGNYTHTRSEQRTGSEAGLPLVATPRHMVNASLRWKTSARLSTWLRGEFRSERYRGANDAYDALGNFKGYGLLHLGGAYDLSKNLTLNAAIYNLLNKDFLRYMPYTTSAGALSYANEYNNNQEPLRLWASLNVRF